METNKTATTDGGAPVVTEEELKKSLDKLEGKAPEPVKEKPQVVVVAGLTKTANQTLEEVGSKELKKALEVSSVLKDFADTVGVHVDQTFSQMQKSIQAAAERDLAVIRVLEDLRKSLDKNTEAIEKYGQSVVAPSKTVTATTTDVLAKSAGGAAGTQVGGREEVPLRTQVLEGLVVLAKSFAPGSVDNSQWTQRAVKFESTGQIEDVHLQKAIVAYRKGQA